MKEFFDLAKRHGIRFTRCSISNRSMFEPVPTHVVKATVLLPSDSKRDLLKLAKSQIAKSRRFEVQFVGTENGQSLRANVRFDLTSATWSPFVSWIKSHFKPGESVSADPFFLDHAVKNRLRFSECVFHNYDPSRPAVKQYIQIGLSVPKSLVDEIERNHPGLAMDYSDASYAAAGPKDPVYVNVRGNIAGKRIARFNGWLADHLDPSVGFEKKQ